MKKWHLPLVVTATSHFQQLVSLPNLNCKLIFANFFLGTFIHAWMVRFLHKKHGYTYSCIGLAEWLWRSGRFISSHICSQPSRATLNDWFSAILLTIQAPFMRTINKKQSVTIYIAKWELAEIAAKRKCMAVNSAGKMPMVALNKLVQSHTV